MQIATAIAITRPFTTAGEGLLALPPDSIAPLKKIYKDGMHAKARSTSSGIPRKTILEIAMIDQCTIKINAKKLIFLLNVINNPSIYNATALGIIGVVI